MDAELYSNNENRWSRGFVGRCTNSPVNGYYIISSYIEKGRKNIGQTQNKNMHVSKENRRVVINICGEKFETRQRTLQRFPNTLLGNSEKRKPYYSVMSDEYYFDRNRACFEQILFFYQSKGILSCPVGLDLNVFSTECKFFDIPDDIIQQMKYKAGILPEFQNDVTDGMVTADHAKLWDIFEHPRSSKVARMVMLYSTFTNVLSIILSTLETVKELRFSSNRLDKNPMAMADLALNGWFLFEFTARLLSTPSKRKFVHNWLNWVDALAVFPYFIIFTINPERVRIRDTATGIQDSSGFLGFLRIFRLVRVLRLFKLSKDSRRLQVVIKIMISSLSDFQTLLLCLFMIVVLFGSTIYYVERSPTSPLTSIPHSMWWAIITILTIGYGDLVPVTLGGKFISGVLMVLGATTISLPILSIVAKFILFYEKNIQEQESQILEDIKRRSDNIVVQNVNAFPTHNRPNHRRFSCSEKPRAGASAF